MERVLNCKCGNTILVTNAQAGRQVNCSSCGDQVAVPTLRGLSELPFAQQTDPNQAEEFDSFARQEFSASTWRWRGPAMAVCLIALVGASFYAFNALRVWYQIDTSRDVDKHLEVVSQVLDSAGPDQLSQMWDDYSGISLQRPDPPDYKLYNDFAALKLRNGQIGGGIAAAMLLVLIVLWMSASWARRADHK